MFTTPLVLLLAPGCDFVSDMLFVSEPEYGLFITLRTDEIEAYDEKNFYVINNLGENVAFRASLFDSSSLMLSDDEARFVDLDEDGIADQGTPMETAFFSDYYYDQDTLPNLGDDPADPVGIYPWDAGDEGYKLRIKGAALGVVYLVAHENGGESTMLEIDEDGFPIEPYIVQEITIVDAS